jgi:3-phenylpropionate/trans-cinnamate dioxygenase ferredoxin reductase subunit
MTEAGKQTVIIIGAGQAGGQCAASLRRLGWSGRIVLAGAEPHPPYQRPPLSKAYLSGDIDVDRLWLQPPDTWQEQNVELRLGVAATQIDRDSRIVTFSDGHIESFDYLVLATGSRVRPLPVPGADLNAVRYLRTIADVDVLKEDFAPGKRIAIIGGGYIGLEAAAVAKKRGAEPIVIEAMDRLLARVAGPELSDFYKSAHESRGVEIRVDAMVDDLEGIDGHVTGVGLADGSHIPCDSALIGIGVIPNQELASDAGLETGNGICIDDHCRTSDLRIFAIGDCAEQDNWLYKRRMRLESVPNALEQAKHAAASICDTTAPKPEIPWFWSDQFDLKLQSAGISTSADLTVLRGSMQEDRFALFHFRDGVLIAADAINDPQSFMAAKLMIAQRARPDANALADPALGMRDVMKAALAAT